MRRKKSIIQHSNELKNRLIFTAGILLALFIPGYFYAAKIYYYFSLPVISNLPSRSELVTTSVTSGFFTPIEMVLWLTLIVSLPLILYQIYAYIKPALLKQESRLFAFMLALGCLLFFGGISVSYICILPNLLRFFIHVLPYHITMMLDMEHYTDFVFKTSILIAIVCEIPIAMAVLVILKIVKASTLKKYRKYYYILAFVVAMLITPPDLIFQICVGIPIILLFETGLLLIKMLRLDKSINSKK